MSRKGRPVKLTPELIQEICRVIRAGNYIETAAAYAGISKSTLYDWLRRGKRAKSGIYRQFSDAVQKALAESEIRDVMIIAKAAEENWQAAAWRLERKFPERWGRKERVQADINHLNPLDVNVRVQYVAEWGDESDRTNTTNED